MLHVSFNNEQRTIGYGWHQNHEAKLKIVEGDLSGSNHQDLDPTIHYITSVIVPSPFVLYWWENKQVTLKLCPDLYQWDTSPYRYTGKRKQTNEQHQILSENLKYYFWLLWYTLILSTDLSLWCSWHHVSTWKFVNLTRPVFDLISFKKKCGQSE